MKCKTARRYIRNRLGGSMPSGRLALLEEHLTGCKSCSFYQEDSAQVAGVTLVKSVTPQTDELKEPSPLPENGVEAPAPLLKWFRPAGVLTIALAGVIVFFALLQSRTPTPPVESTHAVQPVQIPTADPSGSSDGEVRAMRVGGTDSYRLRVKNHRLAGRTVEDLASLLGGDTRSSVIKGNRREVIRLDVSLPPENSAYFLSKLSGLGDLTAPGNGFLKDGTTHRITIDIYSPE